MLARGNLFCVLYDVGKQLRSEWQQALKVAHTQQEHAAIRLANVELMTTYGVNAWRAYNSALEDNNALLKAEVEKLDSQVPKRPLGVLLGVSIGFEWMHIIKIVLQILSINRKRFAEQSDAVKKVCGCPILNLIWIAMP
jgi:hypothetical protein